MADRVTPRLFRTPSPRRYTVPSVLGRNVVIGFGVAAVHKARVHYFVPYVDKQPSVNICLRLEIIDRGVSLHYIFARQHRAVGTSENLVAFRRAKTAFLHRIIVR